MKKFTKGCLFTALILLVTGCIFCSVFGFLGGFQQLDQKGKRMYELGFGDLKFGYTGNGFGFGAWNEDEWDAEWDAAMEDLQILENAEKKVQTECTASEIEEIQIAIGGNALVLEESEDEHIWIKNSSTEKMVKYGMENGCFELRTRKKMNIFSIEAGEAEKEKIYLYLPKGMQLQAVHVELEGGNISIHELAADDMILEIGAGNLTIDSLNAQELELSIGAGKADIEQLKAQNAVMEIGAGNLKMKDFSAENITMDVGMGNLDADGSIGESADIQCGMGNVTLNLEGSEKDYNYNVECSMGNVKVGETKLSSVAAERYVDNGSQRFLDVECAMGNATIRFAD